MHISVYIYFTFINENPNISQQLYIFQINRIYENSYKPLLKKKGTYIYIYVFPHCFIVLSNAFFIMHIRFISLYKACNVNHSVNIVDFSLIKMIVK